MNLYRSFGNLMEAWVSEAGQCSDSEWQENNEEDSPTLTSDPGTNLRSESVDSGVETASSDASFLATSGSVSADVDAFERGGLTPASASPVLPSPAPFSSSSSSPRLRPGTAQEGPAALHRKVEQALQRTDSKKDRLELSTVDEVLRRRPRASFLPKRHTSELLRGQRSENLENFDLRRTVDLSVPVRQMPETRRRPLSMSCVRQPVQTRSEDLGEVDGRGLSPGLSYLEQVCQMLEDIARQQMQNRALQMETDGPLELRDIETFDTCQSDSKPAETDLSSCKRLKNKESIEQTSSEPQWRKNYIRGHFRQRSASDTTLATLHLRKLNADCRGHHLSTDEFLERVEEDTENQESKKGETNKTNKNWRLKIGSLRREGSAASDTTSQQMQPSEKNSARRRLSQLFRRRRKTQPI